MKEKRSGEKAFLIRSFSASPCHAVTVSLEWEKLWHPELAPGPVAALDFLEKIRKM